MKFKQFLAELRMKTGTDDYTLPVADVVTLCNGELEQFALLGTLPNINENHFGKIFPINLTQGNRSYEIPEDMIHINHIELLYNGEWSKISEITLARLDTATDETKILEAFKNHKPRYSIFGNKISIWSGETIQATTEGLKIHGYMYPTPFVEGDFTLTVDRDMSIPATTAGQGLIRQFHAVLLKRCIIEWKGSRDKPISLTQSEQVYQGELGQVIKALRLISYTRKYKMSQPRDGWYAGDDNDFVSGSTAHQADHLIQDDEGIFIPY